MPRYEAEPEPEDETLALAGAIYEIAEAVRAHGVTISLTFTPLDPQE